MSIYNVPLKHITANPWQTRLSPPALEYVKELALDIAANGLMQTPMGRVIAPDGTSRPETHWKTLKDVGGSVQLAFGHNRLAAYRWLFDEQHNSDVPGDWEKMPVDVRALTDEQMSTMAWSENEKRRDMTAIERAKAIQVRLDHFKWTNRECAEVLGIDHSTVSNVLRLLKLPEDLQQAIQEWKLAERAALAILPLFEAPEPHGFSGWGTYIRPESITQSALEGESSDRLRKNVADYFNSNSIDLTKIEFKLDQFFPEGEAIYCATCSTCDHRMASRNRCFDRDCWHAKLDFLHREYLKKASKASGYPLVDDKKGGYTTPLPWNQQERERVIATKCPNLVLEYTGEKTESCIIDGHPHARLVCEKRNDSCTCIKGLKLVVSNGISPDDDREVEELDPTDFESNDDYEKYIKEQTVAAPEVATITDHSLSAGELEEAARQARRDRKEAYDKLPEIRKQLEEHLLGEAEALRPGVFYVALRHYSRPSQDELNTMDFVYRRIAKEATQSIMPNDVESISSVKKHIGQILERLELDPLERNEEPVVETTETLREL